MRITFFLLIVLSPLALLSQSLSESDIKKIAEQVNQKSKGTNYGNGVIARGCLSMGRTLVFQYDVSEHWQAPENIKEELISNFKTAGTAKTYFQNDINADFYYYNGSSLIEKVSIKSNEFSTYNYELGEYLSVKDHPKAKEVNLKLKVPIGWEVKEGDRPNIVKKFIMDNNTYLILIKENMTFFSRNEIKELLQDENFVNEFVQEFSSYLKNCEVIDKSVVTIDTYPTILFKAKGTIERSGFTMPMIIRCWAIFFEDKIVFLQAGGLDNAEFRAFEQLSFLITNSVIFPEQYN